jgi:hypothetical protein
VRLENQQLNGTPSSVAVTTHRMLLGVDYWAVSSDDADADAGQVGIRVGVGTGAPYDDVADGTAPT